MIITIIVMIIIIVVSLTIINLHPKLYLETSLKFLKDEHFLASMALYPSDHFPLINVVDIFFEVT